MLDKINVIISGISRFIYLKEIPKEYINGMELLNKNSGRTSLVFKKNNNEVRIFTRDNMKKDWLCNGLGIGKLVNIYDTKIKYNKYNEFPIYIIVMPFLYPLSFENKKIINKLIKEFDKLHILYLNKRNNKYYEDFINELLEFFENRNQKFYNLVEFLSDYSEDQYSFDLGIRNFKQTKDGDIVFLDPVASKELVTFK